MYLPPAFEVVDAPSVEALLSRMPFGCLITHGPGGLFASHLPFHHDVGERRLIGHLARANPHQERATDEEALVVFQGAHSYVSPNWYPSKAEHGRVVPTWNYEVVHVYGRLTWRSDPAWLRTVVSDLTDRFEAGQSRPWSITDAPEDHIHKQLHAIVGMELAISRIEAKRKMSQNRSHADRMAVQDALAGSDDPADRALAEAMARG